MRPVLTLKIRTFILICISTSFAGVVYQLVNEQIVDYRSVLVGLPLGLAFGTLELFTNINSKLRHWSFTKILLFKTILYTAVIYLIIIILALTFGMLEGTRDLNLLWVQIRSREQLVLTFYTLVVYGLLVFMMQINHLLGEGTLQKFILGKYHQPHEEARIFMFLDMKSSTSIAERLGHVRFYTLLNELFHEISQPVLETRAEIYQYVGDEVVLTWQVEDGLQNANCLKTFFLFRNRLIKKENDYLKEFGVKPEFKAGLHFGRVVSAQIGDLKREIVYNGDVLNTTARLRDECTRLQRDCLVSGVLMQRLRQTGNFQWEELETVSLRGKENEVGVFSVEEGGKA